MSKQKNDMDWRVFVAMNPGLMASGITTKERAINHFKKIQIQNNYKNLKPRKYRIEDLDPNVFNWEEYLILNLDLIDNGIITETKALDHWVRKGYRENRKHKITDESSYISYINYCNKHPGLIGELKIIRNLEIKHNVIESGKTKKILIFLSHSIGGGLSKHVKDIITHFPNPCHQHGDYELITNEKNTNAKYLRGRDIIHLLKSNEKNITLHLHFFTEFFREYTIKDIESILTQFKSKSGQKLIITIHDFFWLYPLNPTPTTVFFDEKNPSDIESTEKIFRLADLVIFPTHGVKNRHEKKGINLSSVNYAIEGHYDYYDVAPYCQTIADKIRIGSY